MRIIFSLVLSILMPMVIFAHGSHGNGIMAGFTHPILGIDHAIAIIGVGFIGRLINQSKWYLFFILFLLAMIIGGFLGINKEATFIIEKIIASSVLVIGLFILFREKITKTIILVCISIFGFFHGYAHGAEMPQDMNSFVYVSGFSLGALLMTLIGMLICKSMDTKNNFEKIIYLLGGIFIGCGIIICLG